MINLLRFFIAFILICSTPLFGETEIQFASPVFEELLANQIASVRRRLIENKILSDQSRILLFLDQKTGEQVVFSLKKGDASIDWDSILFLTEDQATLSLETSEKEIMVVAFGKKSDQDQIETDFEKKELGLGVSFTIPELEYAKDKVGRQIANLGEPYYEQLIFERLVREGLNPVLAHPEANEALHKLRQMEVFEIRFFFRKNLLNLLKNLDFT
jgi:hypothetical protein